MTIGKTRNFRPDLDLTFDDALSRYQFDRDTVAFSGSSMGDTVNCAISREAMDDDFGADSTGQKGRIDAFYRNRPIIERLARAEYLAAPIGIPGNLLIKTTDRKKYLNER
jgi:hypothetical protein